MLHRPRFVIAVPDLQRSANYYRDILGFTIHDIGDPGWRFMQRDEFAILAGECPDAIPPRELGDHSYFAYIGVDHIDALYAELASKNAEILNPPRDEPWGMREFGVTTIDGHRIRFGTPTTKSAYGARSTRIPGFAPVCSPSRNTCTPLTNTCATPVAYCIGFSYVACAAIVFGLKTTTSAK